MTEFTIPRDAATRSPHQKVTVRGTGKAHRAMRRPDGSFYITCSCEVANLETFGASVECLERGITAEVIRNATALYRKTWLNPLIDQIEERLVKRTERQNARTD